MKRIILLTLGFVFIGMGVVSAVMAAQGADGFDATVQAIESRYQVHPTRIPMMFLANAVARVATKGGVRDISVVTFENFKGPVDGAEFNALVEEKLGRNWTRIIRDTHPGSNEQSLIYARPEGSRMRLMVIDLDTHELDLVRVSVDPKHLQDELSKHVHSSHAASGSDADEDNKHESGGAASEDKTPTAASE